MVHRGNLNHRLSVHHHSLLSFPVLPYLLHLNMAMANNTTFKRMVDFLLNSQLSKVEWLNG